MRKRFRSTCITRKDVAPFAVTVPQQLSTIADRYQVVIVGFRHFLHDQTRSFASENFSEQHMFGNADRRRNSAPEFHTRIDSSVALRGLVAAAALLATTVLASAPAQAQFACTFAGIDETCVNSGSAPNSPLVNLNAGGKLTATNTGTGTVNGAFETASGGGFGGDVNLVNAGSVTGGSQSFTQSGGNASANNSGTIAGFFLLANVPTGLNVSTHAGGDATGVNSGNLLSAGFSVNAANTLGGAGNATGTNTASGKISTFFQVETGSSPGGAGGNATGTNAGSVGTFFQVDNLNANTPNRGSATGTNSGSVGQNFSIFTTTGGNAAGTNSGTVGTDFDVMTQGATFIVGVPLALQPAGTATGVNSGSVRGNFNVLDTTLVGGATSGTNSGSVGGNFAIQTSSGQLTVFNSGTVGGGITALSQAAFGNNNNIPTTFVNTGSVGGAVSITTATGGDQTFTNSGSIGGAVSLQSHNGGNMILSNSGKIGGDAKFSNLTANGTNPFAPTNMTMTNSGSIGGSLFFTPLVGTGSFASITLINTGSVGTLGGGGGQLLQTTAQGGGASTIVNSGTINATVFERGGAAASLTNSGTIHDPGSTAINLNSFGANTLTLLQGSSVTGDILLSGGIVNVDSSGLIAGNITGGTTLNFAVGPGTFTYGAAFGFSGFNQVNLGSGTVILNGINSAANIAVSGGNLEVGDATDPTAKLTGAVDVTGGMLSGHGTVVGNVTIGDGATLAPGGSVGTLTVQGNLVLATAASYLVDVSSTGASSTAVSGTATLGGTVGVFSSNNSFRFNSPYTILTSAGLGGTQFNAVTGMAGMTDALSYSGNSVQLTLTSALAHLAGLNINQRAVATALDTGFNASGSTGPLGRIFSGNIPLNLTQASGELGTGSQQTTFDAMNMFLGVMTDPFSAGRDDGALSPSGAASFAEQNDASTSAAGGKARGPRERDAYAAMYAKAPAIADFAQRWDVWAAGFGGSATTDGNTALGSNAANSHISGTVVGADYRFSPSTTAGFALAGGGTSFTVANALGAGRSDLFQAGAYVRHVSGPAYVAAALAYGWQDVTTDRTITDAGVDQLRANFRANAFSARAEGGYRLATPWIGLAPYAAAQFTSVALPDYTETATAGSNAFALAYAGKTVTDPRTELGLRTDRSFVAQNSVLTLRGRLAWAHDFNTDRTIAATFQTLPTASFVVNGAAQAHDAALTTASAELKWINGWSAAATFEGEFSNVTTSYAGKGVVRYQW
jgi:uncharacterized protein with beta-barrel porin domain